MGEFSHGAGIQQRHAAVPGQRVHIRQVPLLQDALCDVLDHEASHVDRVLGGGVRRCVGQIQILQLCGFHSCTNSGSQYINALIHTFVTYELSTSRR